LQHIDQPQYQVTGVDQEEGSPSKILRLGSLSEFAMIGYTVRGVKEEEK
jgi:hypothetical protein